MVEAFASKRARRAARRWRWQQSSTAGDGDDPRRFRVVHPFHPLTGREFELLNFAHTWGEYRVFFRLPGEARVRSLAAEWTDVEGPDAFLVIAAGRTCFRVEHLLQLAALLEELGETCQ